MLGQDTSDSDEFSMSGAVQGAIRFVHSAANDLAILDEHATDGRLIAFECQLSLQMMSQPYCSGRLAVAFGVAINLGAIVKG